jgi:chaperonin GroES
LVVANSGAVYYTSNGFPVSRVAKVEAKRPISGTSGRYEGSSIPGVSKEVTDMPVKKSKLQPLGDRVVVKRLDEEQKTKGGIIVPDTAKEKPQQAEVVAVGPGRISDEGKRIAPEVKKGDKVLFGKYSGTEITVGDDELLILREEDILAIIE